MRVIHQIIEKEINQKILEIQPMAGGDINQVFLCNLKNQQVVIKLNITDQFPLIFEKENKGLELLAKSTFRIPKTICYGNFKKYSYLILEYITHGKINWEIFGEKLAHLHKKNSSKFGLDYDNYIGSIIQKNSYENTWEEFYINQRIIYLTSIARDKGLLRKNDIKKIETLCNKINELIPETTPCLIHGDLWSGNLISDSKNEPVLIDPAVYYGHPEMDWSMLSLFGNYPTIAIERYNEINTIEKGFENRKEVHQLYPLLVHLILFGKVYYKSVMSIIEKFN